MKEIRLSFNLRIALKQTDVHWVEEELLRLREEGFLEVLRRVLREIEEEALKGMSSCGRCGCLWVRKGHEPKRVKTLIGTVRVDWVRLRCQSCGEDIYPLDEAIGLADGEGMMLGVRERALWAAVEVSYEKTSQFLSKFTGLEVSRKKVHQMVVEEGRRIEQLEEDGRRFVFEGGRGLQKRRVRRCSIFKLMGRESMTVRVVSGWSVRWGLLLARGYGSRRIGNG